MKYSRQRELIFKTVVENPIHPTAEMVYNMLKKDNPQLSLGTVYRNLQQLSVSGELLRISIPDKPDRYDGNVGGHYHGICSVCGEMEDIFIDYFKNIDKVVENETGLKVCSHNIMFNVICRQCNKNIA